MAHGTIKALLALGTAQNADVLTVRNRMTTPFKTLRLFKALRLKAGLSVNQAARLLSIDPVSVRRFEMDVTKASARTPPELALKVLRWYIEKTPPSYEKAHPIG